MYQHQGKIAEAIEECRLAIEHSNSNSKKSNEDKTNMFKLQSNLMSMLVDSGEIQKALDLGTEITTKCKDEETILAVKIQQGNIYFWNLKQPHEAFKLWNEVIQSKHPTQVSVGKLAIAKAFESVGKFKQVTSLYASVIRAYEKSYGPHHPYVVDLRMKRANAF